MSEKTVRLICRWELIRPVTVPPSSNPFVKKSEPFVTTGDFVEVSFPENADVAYIQQALELLQQQTIDRTKDMLKKAYPEIEKPKTAHLVKV